MTIKLYTSDWHSRLKDLKLELASAVNGSAVLTDHLKQLLTSFGERAILGGQAETGSFNEAEIKSPWADDPSGPEMHSPGADDTSVEDQEIGKPGAVI